MTSTAPPELMNQTTIVGAVLTVFGIAALVACFQIDLDRDGGWGARIFPLAAAGALVVLGLVELAKGLREGRAIPLPAFDGWAVTGLLILALGYAWAIGLVGYLVSTAIAAPLALLLFGIRDWRGLLAAAVLCPVIYHLIFFVGLGVFPPYGRWFDLLDVIQGY
ncbi:tripartite tricarboxylate transporter TctB family protein [Jannaschia pohangensis]|uniref:Tripartite tricarboxylate transporter TctB family protein n=1 Tax=Jannaschia pohangensis TaxID=390807 RepID=A0A1I3GQ42_9RHOB|nr:tripartite tricarboxylate transporter TctB family protein [Jannaschia pohangensis]SFI25461.1 Tripartite tricarboxylate transporter TctB family protein [Jannaschia pohangensis]